jgi:subtilisin-like proprotein convertase family protein
MIMGNLKSRRLLLVCSFVFVMGAAGVTVGDWDGGDGYKMHFPQLPDPCGWDICVRHQHVADDWVCDETGPVTDIHFWISWKADTVGLIMPWDIYIFDHNPQTGEPNQIKWHIGTAIDYGYHERPAGSGRQGWFCPSEGIPYPDDHNDFYQINITHIEAPFIQEEGHRYWLVIGSPWTDRPIGWKTSQDHFGMAALWTFDTSDWNPVVPGGEPQDLAFVITGGYPQALGACCVGGQCSMATEDDCNTLGGVYLGDGNSCYPPVGNPIIYEADPCLPIPDNDALGVSDTITVPDSFALGDVDVDVVINHTYIGDLIIKIEHLGTIITLWNQACVFRDDIDVIFDDDGNDVICTSPTTGNITPLSTFGEPLSAFNGTDSAGDWTITVSDNANGDVGTLVHWSVHLDESGPNPCGQPTCWDAGECGGQPSGDGTCDGYINLGDLFALKASFGKCAPWTAPECCSDYDQSGCVNLGDLFVLKAGFGTGPYAPSTGNQNCP